MKAHNDANRFLIKTPEVQDFIYNFFGCEGKAEKEQVGAMLKNFQFLFKTAISSHFDGEFGVRNDFMSLNDNYNISIFII